jgi:hypothetical protein
MAKTSVLKDRYEIEAPLGRGGMATVFRGTDRVLNRTVAVKILADRFAGDDKFVTRFRREAQAAARLNHPNIVSIYDTGDDDGAHYIVMELVEGDTLGDVLRRDGALPPERAAAIAGSVAEALERAHQAGLVHRDVKPGNVMLTPDGSVKVMDFGIARAASEDTLTQTGTVLGTAAYLSPEQAQGLAVDARSDLYSLGCVLYEMLTGRQPFTGDSPVSIAYKHVNDDPVPPSRVNPHVSPELDAVTLRAMAKDPQERFPSAGAMREALATRRVPAAAAATATEPITGRRGDTAILPAGEQAPASGRPPPGGRRWLPLVPAAAAVAALIGILLLALAGDERRGERGGQRPREAEQAPPPESQAPELTVEQALGGLGNVVAEGLSAGEVGEHAAEEILKKGEEAAARYAEGELDKALEELSKAHEETDKFLAEGEITSSVRADAIHEAIDLVAATMEASPPAPPEEEGEGEEGDGEGEQSSGGPGNSESAPGQGGEGDKGKD